MMGDAQHATRAVFTAALALNTPEERARYLDEACQGKPELRQRVEILLHAHEQASSFLEAPAASPPKQTIVLSPSLTEKPGDKIGHYKLLEEIGEGAFGRVFMAEQTEPVNRKVALKIIKAGMDTREVIARFEAERQALALMDHSNIAKVLDAGATDKGRPYFVMELVRGIPITAYCEQQRLSMAERLQLFMKVCHAVQHAHQKAIIHRDLKPTNILVTVIDGEAVPKVIDFGVAKALGQKLTEKTLFTAFQEIIGTPAYMSPEQAALSGMDVDTRSDIYSLGVLLYELLTGVTPFTKETLANAALDEIRRMIRETEPPKPSTRLTELARRQKSEVRSQQWKEVRGDLDCIVMKCLEKDRARRYETANGLADDIERHLHQEPVTAAAPSALYRARKFMHRHKAGLATATALVLLLAGGAVVSSWQAVRATRAKLSESRLRQRAEAEKERADAKTKEAEAHAQQARQEKETARFNLHVARTSLIQQELENQRVGLALNLLERQRPQKGEEDLRGFEWYYLWRRCNRGLLATLRGHEREVRALAFSPDGTTLVSGSMDGTVRLWDVTTGREQATLVRNPTVGWCVAFSPDGKTVAWGSSDGTITLWDVTKRTERTNIKGHTSAIRNLAFSPDSRTLASTSRDQTVRLWEVQTGAAVGPAFELGGSGYVVAFSPDGGTLAATDFETIRLYDVTARRLRHSLIGHRFWMRALGFFPDGNTLLSGGNNSTIKFWDVATGREKTTLEQEGQGETLALSSDGTQLALGLGDGTVEVRDLASRQKRFHGHSDTVFALAFSPDGRILASGSGDRTIKLWDVRSPGDFPPAQKQEKMIWRVAFSSDGKLVVSAGDNQAVKLWDVATGQMLSALPSTGFHASFSPDGKTLAIAESDTIRLWDVATWQPRAALKGHVAGVFVLRFSPDGKTLASGSYDKSIRLWDLATGQTRATLTGHTAWTLFSMAFSPDSATLASATGEHCFGGEVILWDVASGERRATPPGGTTSVAFSPDGKTLASGAPGSCVALWDPATGQKQAEMSGHVRFTRDLSFLPEGKMLASCNSEGSVTIWDVVRRQERAVLRKSGHSVWSLAVSPDGRTLATGGENGEVEFWRAADEQEVRTQSPVFDYRIESAGRYSTQGMLLQERGQDLEAEKAYLDAVTLYERVAAEFPGRTEYRQGLAATYRHLLNLMAKRSQLATPDCRRAPALADKAIELARGGANPAPEEASLWHEKAKLLERAGQPNEALAAFSRAIELAGANTNAYAQTLVEARLSRSDLLKRMNRLAEALADRCQAFNVPLRDPQAKSNLVDLSLFYNAGLKQNWHGDVSDNDLAALPTGIQNLSGTEFDIRGLVQVSRLHSTYPALLTNIPVSQVCRRLHFLHAAIEAFNVPDGVQIGRYVVHYLNGQQRVIPLVTGQDLADWWEQAKDQGKPLVVAWTGANGKSQRMNCRVRLYLTTWLNPLLDVPIQSLDFEAMDNQASPFLVAITVE